MRIYRILVYVALVLISIFFSSCVCCVVARNSENTAEALGAFLFVLKCLLDLLGRDWIIFVNTCKDIVGLC